VPHRPLVAVPVAETCRLTEEILVS